MKKILLILPLMLLIINCQNIKLRDNLKFFVSPTGNDSWSGKLSQPDKEQTDGPFATIDRAQRAVRQIIKEEKLPAKGITIYVREGNYYFSNSIELSEFDSGSKNKPIIWQAYPGEKVKLIGGMEISGFKKITDPKIVKRLNKNCVSNILQINLKQHGISDFGEITPKGGPGIEIFYQNKRMQIARYPNDNWLKIADVPQHGKKRFHDGLEREKRYDGVPVGRHYGRIKFTEDRPLSWSADNDIYLHGYWTWDWADAYQKLASIDKKNKEIIFAEPHHNYGYTKNQRYYFLNVLEELDQPGEWYLNKNTSDLYFYPPDKNSSTKIFVSILKEPLIELKNAQFINIQNIHFTISRGSGIFVNNGNDNLIAGCTFSNLGANAVIFDGGKNNGIQSCDIFDVSMGGIVLNGGNRKKLEPAGNFAKNNHIHHYSEWLRTWQLAISIDGVGNYVAHNLIHDAPHEAMYVRGNEHLLEFNEIYHVCEETGDAGAIHTGRNYTWRGNVYRHNYFHHLKGPGLHGVTAIYFDDFTSGYTAYGNICYKSGRGVLIGGGRDNLIQNNIFIKCKPSLVLDARGLSWAHYHIDEPNSTLRKTMKEMNAQNPPYSTKYPKLVNLFEDEPGVPKNNKILNNISTGGRWIELYDYFAYDFSVVTLKGNLIGDSIVCKRIKEKPEGWEPYYLNLDGTKDYINFMNGDKEIASDFKDDLFTLENVIEFNPNNIKKLKISKIALDLGFQKIPVEKIGLQIDEFRKILPLRKQKGSLK